MVVQCPFCGTTRDTHKEIRHGTRLRCPFCRNVFRPPLVDTAGPKPDDPKFAAVVEVALDELPTPPTMPPSESPKTEVPENDRFVMRWISPNLVAGVLGVCILGLCLGVLSWHVRQVRTGEKMATEGPNRRGSRNENLIGPDPPLLPELPVVQQKLPTQKSAGRLQQPVQPGADFSRSAPPAEVAVPLPKVVQSLLQPFSSDVDDPLVRPVCTPGRILSDEDQKKASSKVYRAKKLEKEGKVRLANKLYQEVIEKYPDTTAAEEAQEHVGYTLDKRVERAAKLLALGQGFELTHSNDEALGQYKEIVSLYPETEQAKTAGERIKALSGKK
jgi:hypothetical protein